MSAPASARIQTTGQSRPGNIAEVNQTSEEAIGSVSSGEMKAAPEQVARLAYSYWEARGFQGGSPEEDWYRAEKSLRDEGESDA